MTLGRMAGSPLPWAAPGQPSRPCEAEGNSVYQAAFQGWFTFSSRLRETSWRWTLCPSLHKWDLNLREGKQVSKMTVLLERSWIQTSTLRLQPVGDASALFMICDSRILQKVPQGGMASALRLILPFLAVAKCFCISLLAQVVKTPR